MHVQRSGVRSVRDTPPDEGIVGCRKTENDGIATGMRFSGRHTPRTLAAQQAVAHVHV
jgi:hypothetical protein